MIENKRIWITGASSGIGSELALQLADAGNTVVISARTADKLRALEVGAEVLSGKIIPLAYDVTEDDQTANVREALVQAVDSLDMLIICAGTCEYVDNTSLEVDMFRRVFDVNVFGAVNATAVALPLLEAANHPAGDKPQIVAVASLSAVTGLPRAEAYGASKQL